MKTVAIAYGISVLLSFLLIRMGFALDEKGHKADGETLSKWFLVMFTPVLNVLVAGYCSFSLLFEKMQKNNVTESFLKHLFLSRKQIKKK